MVFLPEGRGVFEGFLSQPARITLTLLAHSVAHRVAQFRFREVLHWLQNMSYATRFANVHEALCNCEAAVFV